MMIDNPDSSLLLEKELFIFDMDGTIYLGSRVFDFAINFINNLRAHGKRVLFFTNNTTKTTDFYIEKLQRLGFGASESEVMTAGDVTKVFLKRYRAGKSVYLLATDQLVADFEKSGIDLVSVGADKADIVVTSFDTTLTYEKLNTACRLIRRGAEYFCTHPDYNCPTDDGFIPDSGAIAACVTASTKVEPTYFGKPYAQTLDMICEFTGVSKEKMCIFGDRLYTDIALGAKNGVTSVLVLTGETRASDIEDAEFAPDFVFNSLDDVNMYMFM